MASLIASLTEHSSRFLGSQGGFCQKKSAPNPRLEDVLDFGQLERVSNAKLLKIEMLVCEVENVFEELG